MPVSVFDHNGRVVRGIPASDFNVFVDGVQVEKFSIDVDREPLDLVLVLDMSPSTAVQIGIIKGIASKVVENLRPNDRVMVVGFNNEMKVATGLTSDRPTIAKAVKKLEVDNGTSLYNAVSTLFEKHLAAVPGCPTVFLLTDGVDTTSRKATYQSSLVAAEKACAVIIPIYVNTFETQDKGAADLQARLGVVFPAKPIPEAEYKIGRYYLTDLILLSGGRAIQVGDSQVHGIRSFDGIADELRSRYYIAFERPSTGPSGTHHSVTVRVNRSGLTVLSKGSYID
ncbi:MAG: VWA domain-containing protein [Pyrinomonadaceae bacterium]